MLWFTCKNCGQQFEFQAESFSLNYCSPECEATARSKELERLLSPEYETAAKPKELERLLWPTCFNCRTAYDPALRFAHGGCCSPECKQQLDHARSMILGRQVTCAKCGTEFAVAPGQRVSATPYCAECQADRYGLTSTRTIIESAKQTLEWAKPDPAVLSMVQLSKSESAMLRDMDRLLRSPLTDSIAEMAKAAESMASFTASTRSIMQALEPTIDSYRALLDQPWLEPITWTWPGIEPRERRPAPLPEPPAQPQRIERIEQQEPEVRQMLSQWAREGKLKPADLLFVLDEMSESKPGPQEAPLEIQIKMVERYETLKRRHGRQFTQEIFVSHHCGDLWACSLATFKRYRRRVKLLKNLS